MKAAVDEDDSGWELSVPEKMEKCSTSWVDITQDFEDACRGKFEFFDYWFKVRQDKVKSYLCFLNFTFFFFEKKKSETTL